MIFKKHYIQYLINNYRPSYYKNLYRFRITTSESYFASDHLIVNFKFYDTLMHTEITDEFEYLNFLTYLNLCYLHARN